jgi:uncharacterized protein (DUF427 family)
VWDYPRPPRIEPDGRRVVVRLVDTVVADTARALRVLETASPPTFYLPPADVRMELLRPARGASRCEWKGTAEYWTIRTPEGDRAERAAWSYPSPFPGFEEIRDYVSFYPVRVDCYVDGAPVHAQTGGFYGGWITPEIVGPFKGEPGSSGW